MFYSGLDKFSITEAPGISVVLYVSGCLPNKCKEGNCPGCHNAVAQSFIYGQAYTDLVEEEILEALNNSKINTFVLCGGEPFDQKFSILYDLLFRVKNKYPDKTIWVYTGYNYDTLPETGKKLLELIDVLVVGPYEQDKRDISDKNMWRGSTNQRVLDVKKSLEAKKPVAVENILNNEV